MPDIHELDDAPAGSFFYHLRTPKPGGHDTAGETSTTDGLWELIETYKEAGRPDKIKECVNEILAGAPDHETAARCHHTLGCLFEQEWEFQAAVSHYRKAASFKPENRSLAYWIHNNLGYSLNIVKQFTEAAAECRQAIEIDPTRSNAFKNLGLALTGMGQFTEAVRSYFRATKANAADPRSLALLEQLVHDHPDLLNEIDDIQGILEECRNCANTYNTMHDKCN